MTFPKLTRDIMITDVRCITERDTLLVAHQVLRENNIRHLPVVSSINGDYLGLITQKVILKQALLSQGARAAGDSMIPNVPVATVMVDDVETIQPELSLIDAGGYFIGSKHGCLPVVVEGKLRGIITSADFVRLAVMLLKDGVGKDSAGKDG